MIPLEEEE